MNLECANKLLKLIEEPPARTIFLLISEDLTSVIPTIKSRCQPVYIPPIAYRDMMKTIQDNYGLNNEDAQSVAHIANGSFIKAKELIETNDEVQLMTALFDRMMNATTSRKIKLIKNVAEELSRTGREVQKSFLIYSLRMFREYFVNNLKQSELIYLNRQELKMASQFSSTIHEQNIQTLLDEFSLAHKQIQENGNAKIIFLDLC